MAVTKTTYRHYVALFLPTKDKNGVPIPEENVASWRNRAEDIFRTHVGGYYVALSYSVRGNFRSSGGEWISEQNFIVKAFGPRHAIRKLIKALENEIIPQLGIALNQESVALESSIEGLTEYHIRS